MRITVNDATGADSDYANNVVEFASGVTVQEVTTGDLTTEFPDANTLTSIDTATSFAVLSWECNDTSNSNFEDCFTSAEITSSTNLEIARDDDTASSNTTAYVVEGDSSSDFSTQKFTFSWGTSSTHNETISSVTTGNSFIVLSFNVNNNFPTADDIATRCVITNSTNVDCSRDNTDNRSTNVIGWVVELNDGGSVQQIDESTGSTSSPLDETITAVDLTLSSEVTSLNHQRQTSSAGAHRGYASRTLTSTTNHRIAFDDSSSDTFQAEGYVVEWNDGGGAVNTTTVLHNSTIHGATITSGS